MQARSFAVRKTRLVIAGDSRGHLQLVPCNNNPCGPLDSFH